MTTTPNPVVVLVSGKSGSGMTTLCRAIEKALCEQGIKCAIASLLEAARAATCSIYGDIASEGNDNKKFDTVCFGVDGPVAVHEAILEIDEALRIGHNLTASASSLERRIAQSSVTVYIVDDVRYLCDLGVLRASFPCLCVRLKRPGTFAGDIQMYEQCVDTMSISETDLDTEVVWDLVLAAAESPQAESAKVVELLRPLLAAHCYRTRPKTEAVKKTKARHSDEGDTDDNAETKPGNE